MELIRLKNAKVKMVFEVMKKNVKFNKNHFTFKIPGNTNINGDFTPKIKKKKSL